MRKRKLIILCFLFSIFYADYTKAKSKYNLDFQHVDSINFNWCSAHRPLLRIDSSASIHNKYPIVLEQKKISNTLFFDLLRIDLQQTFLLPDSLKHANVKVSINNKCLNMEKLLLKVICLNEHQRTMITDSININNAEQWEENMLILDLKDTKFMIVGLDGYSPNFQEKSSKLYLDRIKIELNNQDIEEIDGINNLPTCMPIKSYKELIISDTLDIKFFRKIKLPDKKIIALGETVHGSAEISECIFDILKENIITNNCRCVMLEEDMSMLLKMNLFVKGKLPINSLEEIKKDMIATHINTDALCRFLSWLRKYNNQSSSKVNLWGIEPRFLYERNALFDYLYAFYDVKYRAIFYTILENLKSLSFTQAYSFATTQSTNLKKVMGEEEFQKFMYVLGFYERMKVKIKNPINNYLYLRNRDYYIFENIDYFLRNHLSKNEKVFIYTHYLHVQKNETLWINFPVLFSAGYYLNKQYKEEYGVVGITLGKGNITTRNNYNLDRFNIHTLALPSKSSLEALFMNVNKKYIYCMTSNLPTNIYLIKAIGNRIWIPRQEFYNAVKDCADGFIFIRDSHSFTDKSNNAVETFYIDKYIQRKKILKQLQKNYNSRHYENQNKPL